MSLASRIYYDIRQVSDPSFSCGVLFPPTTRDFSFQTVGNLTKIWLLATSPVNVVDIFPSSSVFDNLSRCPTVQNMSIQFINNTNRNIQFRITYPSSKGSDGFQLFQLKVCPMSLIQVTNIFSNPTITMMTTNLITTTTNVGITAGSTRSNISPEDAIIFASTDVTPYKDSYLDPYSTTCGTYYLNSNTNFQTNLQVFFTTNLPTSLYDENRQPPLS